MLYLIWALLNIAIFVFFILLCFKATKLVREKFGVLGAIILVVGLLSFMGSSGDDQENKRYNSNQMSTWTFTPVENIETYSTRFHTLTLQRNLISGYQLGIRYGIDKGDHLNTPIDAYSYTIGLVSGTKWKPVAIVVNKTDDNKKFQYSITGTVEWKLLGVTIFSQSKDFDGITAIK